MSRSEDGVYRISNSELRTFKRCERRWWLAYYRTLAPLTGDLIGPRRIGTRVHASLAEYYGGTFDVDAALKTYNEMAKEDVDRFIAIDPMADATKLMSEIELGRIMVEGYYEWAEETGADEGLEIIAPETVIEVPTAIENVHLRGKLDLRMRRDFDGARFFVDHKGHPASTRLLTSRGWIDFGDVTVGTKLIAGADGTTTTVTGVYPLGKVPLVDVTFSTGDVVRCTEDHLWRVFNVASKTWHVKKTSELAETIRYSTRWKWRVPLSPAHDLLEEEHYIKPYTLGVLLGDGALSHGGAAFSGIDDEIAKTVEAELPTPYRLSRTSSGGRRCSSWSIVGGRPNQFGVAIREMGLKVKSESKFIPPAYLQGTHQQRLDLLRGLMDTDGCCRASGKQCLYVTTSRQLADDVKHLVQSLGGRASVSGGKPGRTHQLDGTITSHLPVWTTSVWLPENPFTLSRKAMMWRWRETQTATKAIISVAPAGVDDAACIMVDHPNHLYIVDGYTVTHNTTQSLGQFDQSAQMDEQLLTYHLMEKLELWAIGGEQTERTDGGMFNLLRKVKRTARATPPFYGRVIVRHNDTELRNFYTRVHGTIRKVLDAERRLNAGEPHQFVVPPNPTNDCHWQCDFYQVCPLFDDGSRSEDFLTAYFKVVDPDERYKREIAEKVEPE